VITAQGLAGEEVRDLLDRADALAIPLARLPRLTEFQATRADARGQSSRSRSRICSGGRRRCSTARRWPA